MGDNAGDKVRFYLLEQVGRHGGQMRQGLTAGTHACSSVTRAFTCTRAHSHSDSYIKESKQLDSFGGRRQK